MKVTRSLVTIGLLCITVVLLLSSCGGDDAVARPVGIAGPPGPGGPATPLGKTTALPATSAPRQPLGTATPTPIDQGVDYSGITGLGGFATDIMDRIQYLEHRIAALEQLHPTPTPTNTPTPTLTYQQSVAAEYQIIQGAVFLMMTDNTLVTIPNPVTTVGGINDMSRFPDSASQVGTNDKLQDPDGTHYSTGDKPGYLLYDHDVTADGAATGLIRYVSLTTTANWYTVKADGTVTQYDADVVQVNP